MESEQGGQNREVGSRKEGNWFHTFCPWPTFIWSNLSLYPSILHVTVFSLSLCQPSFSQSCCTDSSWLSRHCYQKLNYITHVWYIPSFMYIVNIFYTIAQRAALTARSAVTNETRMTDTRCSKQPKKKTRSWVCFWACSVSRTVMSAHQRRCSPPPLKDTTLITTEPSSSTAPAFGFSHRGQDIVKCFQIN